MISRSLTCFNALFNFFVMRQFSKQSLEFLKTSFPKLLFVTCFQRTDLGIYFVWEIAVNQGCSIHPGYQQILISKIGLIGHIANMKGVLPTMFLEDTSNNNRHHNTVVSAAKGALLEEILKKKGDLLFPENVFCLISPLLKVDSWNSIEQGLYRL